MEVVGRIGQVCRDARQARGVPIGRIAATAPIGEPQLSMFERGLAVPKQLDAVVEAYESELEIEDGEIWRRVIQSADG